MDRQINEVRIAAEGAFVRFLVLSGLGLIFTLAALIAVATQ